MKALVAGLGIAQIISWGSLFYAIGVLGPAMRIDLGVGELYLFGAFTGGLFLSGAFAPLSGRLIDRHGGRLVLSAGTLLGAASMFLLAIAAHPLVMVAGWLLAGIAMAACLYDPAFATLSQHTGTSYRRAVTALTLFGGFASTVFWPLSQWLLEWWGWRYTFAFYGALHLAVCLPIHYRLVPLRAPRGDARPGPAHDRPIAMTVSMMVGPAQVAGRIVELWFGRNVSAISVGYCALALMIASLAMLIGINGMGIAAIAFVVAYGFGNGVLTIVRGTIPGDLFGRESLGELLGYLSRASIVARAAAPAAFSGLLALGLGRSQAIGVVLVSAVLAVGAYFFGTRKR